MAGQDGLTPPRPVSRPPARRFRPKGTIARIYRAMVPVGRSRARASRPVVVASDPCDRPMVPFGQIQGDDVWRAARTKATSAATWSIVVETTSEPWPAS